MYAKRSKARICLPNVYSLKATSCAGNMKRPRSGVPRPWRELSGHNAFAPRGNDCPAGPSPVVSATHRGFCLPGIAAANKGFCLPASGSESDSPSNVPLKDWLGSPHPAWQADSSYGLLYMKDRDSESPTFFPTQSPACTDSSKAGTPAKLQLNVIGGSLTPQATK